MSIYSGEGKWINEIIVSAFCFVLSVWCCETTLYNRHEDVMT